MSIGSRIRELRESKNISRNEFATMVGVTIGAISNYENDVSSPKEPILFKIIEALDCDANYLFQDVVKIKTQQNDVTLAEYDVVKKYRFISKYSPEGKETVDYILNRELKIAEILQNNAEAKRENTAPPVRLINYYYRLASAGTGQILFDMPPTKRIEIPDIPEYRKVDYAIGVNGDSMKPAYNDGDMLLVEMTDEIEINEIGIFSVNGDCYVKKLGKGELISLNTKYDNVPLNETAKCMGRVLDKL